MRGLRPTGALIAAVQISTRALLASNWTEVWEKQTHGPDKAATLSNCERSSGAGLKAIQTPVN